MHSEWLNQLVNIDKKRVDKSYFKTMFFLIHGMNLTCRKRSSSFFHIYGNFLKYTWTNKLLAHDMMYNMSLIKREIFQPNHVVTE